jgi:hypothetical protein
VSPGQGLVDSRTGRHRDDDRDRHGSPRSGCSESQNQWHGAATKEHRRQPIDQIRSEVFAQLLTGELAPDGKKARVNITGNLETMERLNNEVGYLEGFGRSMPTSCGRSSTSNTTLPGPSRSRTQQPARSMWAPRHVAPLHPSSANSRRDTRPVSLPDVVSLRLNATSTTPETGRSVG